MADLLLLLSCSCGESFSSEKDPPCGMFYALYHIIAGHTLKEMISVNEFTPIKITHFPASKRFEVTYYSEFGSITTSGLSMPDALHNLAAALERAEYTPPLEVKR